MPLKKNKDGSNMYDWVTHTWNCIIGKCKNECSYCYVQTSQNTKDNPMYKGESRFNEKDANINLGEGKVIFVCHTNDLFTLAFDHPVHVISTVLDICEKYPKNKYVFQTKLPLLAIPYLDRLKKLDCVFGTTIETDDFDLLKPHTKADNPVERAKGLSYIGSQGIETFVTIEPILKFTPAFADLILSAHPKWINIGADSKKNNLPEPTWEEVMGLYEQVKDKVEVRKKLNLDRLEHK